MVSLQRKINQNKVKGDDYFIHFIFDRLKNVYSKYVAQS